MPDGRPMPTCSRALGSLGPATQAIILVSIVLGTACALNAVWISDDAFISFRYAENLVAGRGLVFNGGERVEAISNPTWTLWIALGLELGVKPVLWAHAWSIAAYVGTLLALVAIHLRFRSAWSLACMSWPVALVLGALHADWHVFATGGLETSLFTFLAVLGYYLVTRREPRARWLVSAGVVFAACALTRPDGLLFAGLSGAFLLITGTHRIRAALIFSLAFAVIWLPATGWRIAYYGDFFPNTYYAKSASQSWFEQGVVYVELYFFRYWPLLLGVPVVLWALLAGMKQREPASALLRTARHEGLLALLFAFGYTFYVARVGGDFMFARFLIPATPFFLILLEIAVLGLGRGSVPAQVAVGSVLAILLWFTPQPFEGIWGPKGIVFEQLFYTQARGVRTDEQAAELREAFAGLEVRLAFMGSEARLIYGAQVPVAIECEAGLTDPVIAKQPLTGRGRPGHEKHAPLEYLVGERKAHFIFHPMAASILRLDEHIPIVEIRVGSRRGRVLHWDPDLMEALRNRGVSFDDFPARLDRYILSAHRLPPEQRKRDWRLVQNFYFDHVDDERRRSDLVAVLEGFSVDER